MSLPTPATPPPPADPRPGWAVFGLVLTVVATGLVYLGVAPQHWLRGIVLVAGGVVLAGLARAFLTDRRAGPLLMRGRVFDAGCFLVVGFAVLVCGFVVS